MSTNHPIKRHAESGNAQLVVAWTTGSTYTARVVKMSGIVRTALKDHALEAAGHLDAPVTYATDADMEDNSHMEALRDDSLDSALIDELSKGDSLDVATEDDLRSKTLICHALVITSNTHVILFIKKRSPIQLARKSLLATLANDKLDKLTSPLFAFDDKYDAIIDKDKVYILNKKAFEGLFKQSEAVLKKAAEWVDEVAQTISFTEDSIQELKILIRKNSVLRNKFLAMKSRPHLHHLKADRLRQEMGKYGLDPENLMEEDQLRVTKENAKDILRLLNEDLFIGGFSQEQYAASAKRPLL